MAQHNLFGQEAEQKALSFLLDKGYILLEKNYRFGKAEIDLLMQYKDTLICVEVKARSSEFFGAPESFISSKKIKLLVGAVNHYIEKYGIDFEVRFDVIAFTLNNQKWNCKHIENAFYAWE
ncbi:MAG: YraN family protein [Flavobacteriaceae bacterium]|jgi:putative endonuclease|nr:YraN family protein [Flavobacteriaceae bacterium]